MLLAARMGRLFVAGTLFASLAGCHYYEDFRLKKTQADVQGERAELMRAYRECLQKYEDDPRKSREHCSAYTQSVREIESKR